MRTERHAIGLLVHAETRAEWRAWLRANHKKRSECWLVIHRKATGRPFVAYDDAVEEALCWGWIDSTVKGLGGTSRAQRYTPRRPGAQVSELNRARVRKLVRRRKMTKAGLAALPGVDEWLNPPPLVVPPDIRAALEEGAAWGAFEAFDESYQRIRVGYIDMARNRPDEFTRRLANLVKQTAAGKRFGTIVD